MIPSATFGVIVPRTYDTSPDTVHAGLSVKDPFASNPRSRASTFA